MLSVPRIHVRSVFGMLLTALLVSTGNCAETLRVYNDTEGVVTFWLRSETHPPNVWKHWHVKSHGWVTVNLISPDRFKLACTVPGGARFVSDLVPLRAELRANPKTVLNLGCLACACVMDEDEEGNSVERDQSPWRWKRRRTKKKQDMELPDPISISAWLESPEGNAMPIPAARD